MPTLAREAAQLFCSARGTLFGRAEAGHVTVLHTPSGRHESWPCVAPERFGYGLRDGATPALVSVETLDEQTRLSWLGVPGRAALASADVDGAATLAAVAGDHVVLADCGRARLRVVASDGRCATLPLRGQALRCLETPNGQLFIVLQGRGEVWDLWSCMPRLRLNLPFGAQVRAAGYVDQGRVLWVASVARLQFFRLSDGRELRRVDSERAILGVDGALQTREVVMATQGVDGAIALERVGAYGSERLAVTLLAPPLAFVVVPGEPAELVVETDGGMQRLALPFVAPKPPAPRPERPPAVDEAADDDEPPAFAPPAASSATLAADGGGAPLDGAAATLAADGAAATLAADGAAATLAADGAAVTLAADGAAGATLAAEAALASAPAPAGRNVAERWRSWQDRLLGGQPTAPPPSSSPSARRHTITALLEATTAGWIEEPDAEQLRQRLAAILLALGDSN